MELIPAIDIIDGRCVRLRQGDYDQETVFNHDPVAVAKQWADQGASRIHLVDLDGAKAGSVQNGDVIRSIVEAVKVPCQLGGGIRTTETVEQVLNDIGVERAIIGTQALKDPDWFRKMVEKFPHRMALGIDAKDSMVATEGWLDVSKTSAIEMASQFTGIKLAAVIYTNIANDGMMQGIDQGTLDDFAKLADLDLPVIASGGVTTMQDIRNLLEVKKNHPQLTGAIIGRALYEETIKLPEAIRIVNEG